MELKFNKINNKWYVDLPDWKGDFDDLEMVLGADDLLEAISNRVNKTSITFEVWLQNPNFPTGILRKFNQDSEGASYNVDNCLFYNGTAWLCNVTKFVFNGFHPNTIYFRMKN